MDHKRHLHYITFKLQNGLEIPELTTEPGIDQILQVFKMMRLSLRLEHNIFIFPCPREHNGGVLVCKAILNLELMVGAQVTAEISANDVLFEFFAL